MAQLCRQYSCKQVEQGILVLYQCHSRSQNVKHSFQVLHQKWPGYASVPHPCQLAARHADDTCDLMQIASDRLLRCNISYSDKASSRRCAAVQRLELVACYAEAPPHNLSCTQPKLINQYVFSELPFNGLPASTEMACATKFCMRPCKAHPRRTTRIALPRTAHTCPPASRQCLSCTAQRALDRA